MLLAPLTFAPHAKAAEAPKTEPDWETRCISLSWEELAPYNPPFAPYDEPPHLPLPTTTDSAEVRQQKIKASTEALAKVMEEYLPPFPAGTALLYDPAFQTLTIRSTPDRVEMLKLLSRNLPKVRTWQGDAKLTIAEVDETTAKALLQATADGSIDSHHQAWRDVEAQIDARKASIIEQSRFALRSGKKISVSSHNTSHESHDTAQPEGAEFQFEIDPVILERFDAFKAEYRLTWNAGAKRKSPQDASIASSPASQHATHLAAQGNFAPGRARLIGVWNSKADQSGPRLCAFFQCYRYPGTSKRDEDLKALLELDKPPAPPESASLPVGIYRVPKDYMSLGSSSADPFAQPSQNVTSGAAGPKVPAHSPDVAMHILKGQGIHFPKGAYAAFHPTGLLMVRGTQENLDQAEAFVCMDSWRPSLATVTIHVFECAPKVLIELEKETHAEPYPSHAKLLQKCLSRPEVKWLDAARVELDNGIRGESKSGLLIPQKEVISAPATTDPDKDTQTDEEQPHDALQPWSEALVKSGLKVIVEPYASPDGETIDADAVFVFGDTASKQINLTQSLSLRLQWPRKEVPTRMFATWREPSGGTDALANAERVRMVFITIGYTWLQEE